MDIARPDLDRTRRRRSFVRAAIGLGVIAAVTAGVSQLRPAAPSVARAGLWIDVVEQGAMVREVRGPGTLVPEQSQWLAAEAPGRVRRIVLRPGAAVQPETVVLELASPEIEQAAAEAMLARRAAEADHLGLRARLEGQLLDAQAGRDLIEVEAREAQLRADADARLAREGLVSDLTRQVSAMRAEQLTRRIDIEQQRLARNREAIEAQLATSRAHLEQLRALEGLRHEQAGRLMVRAGLEGVLQEVPVEAGQVIAAGAVLARVADPTRLRAELRIAETQAKEVRAGQVVSLDLRLGVVPGRVTRVDPAVRDGVVRVDVTLDGALPEGARPDLSLDGTIEIERLVEVLHVGRPAHAQPAATIGLYRLEPDGAFARRVPVTLGRTSVNRVEVVSGLEKGDRVILSDASAWDGAERIRLN